jgi:tetratricopeptide (TPR) repeat protein
LNRELKQQIKQDELVHAYEASADWVRGHKSQARKAVEIGAAVAAVALALALFLSWRGARATRALDEGLEIFHGRVATEGPGNNEPGAGTTYATPQQKFEKAAEAFEKAAGMGGEAGARARYYLALSQARLGKHAEAEKSLQELASRSSGLQQDLANVALAELHLSTKQADKAIDELKKLSEKSDLGVPREYALMRLGAALEQANRTDEAVRSYRRVADEFPTGAYAGDARKRLQALGAPGPAGPAS